MKKKVDNNLTMIGSGWSFSNIEKKFDSHVKKSIPFYEEIHKLCLSCSEFFTHDNAIFLDIGCSTGSLTKKFTEKYPYKNFKIKFIGIDTVKSMIDEAKKKNRDKRTSFKQSSIINFNIKKRINLITSVFTIQFINPEERQKAYDAVYKNLTKGGAFILFEKVLSDSAKFQDMYNGIYNDFKRSNKFTEEQIAQKSLSLRGKLESYSSNENKKCLKMAGFKKINTIFKWLCFEGVICVK